MREKLLNFISSLKLTIVLLLLGLLIVFVGTVAQADEGLYYAQARYFKSWIVWGFTMFGHKVGLPLPGGYTIGCALLVNLTAAHFSRFKFEGRKTGIFMVHAGLILLLLGQLGTDLLSVESAMRLEEGETKNYSEDFQSNELVFVNTSGASEDEVVSVPESFLAKQTEIRDARLPVTVRVKNYWPNCDIEDRPPTNAVPAPATHGLMTNQLVQPLADGADSKRARAAALVEISSAKGVIGTFLLATRSSMPQTFELGGNLYQLSMLFAPVMGGNQIVVSDANARDAEPVMWAEKDFAKTAEKQLTNPAVTLKVKQFWPRCVLHRELPKNTVFPALTAGELIGAGVAPRPVVRDMDNRNMPAAVVELLDGGKSLGTYLTWVGSSMKQTVSAGGKTYELALRFRRHYTPYSLSLLKFTHDKYRGTDIPKDFRARVAVNNPAKGDAREVDIWMNNPLRYGGLTYYQASFAPDNDQRERKVTTLQVVRNPGWITPYFACVMVGAGLLVQFMTHFIGFIVKRRAAK